MQFFKGLHIKIKQYRVVYISFGIYICILTHDMWQFYKANFEQLEMASSSAFGAMFLAILGIVKFLLDGLRKDSGND